MERKIISFYDALLYTIICGPMIVASIILFFIMGINRRKIGTNIRSGWIYKNWYTVLIFAVSFAVPIASILFIRFVSIERQTMYFCYSIFNKNWEKIRNNIDMSWNQNVIISEIKDIEIVKLTKEEKQTKVYFKHWFNKYLKINLKYGKSKYVYVGNYSNQQKKKIIEYAKINKN